MTDHGQDRSAALLRLVEQAGADDQRLRGAVDQAIERLTALRDAGRVSRAELQTIVEDRRAAVAQPRVFGDDRAAGAA